MQRAQEERSCGWPGPSPQQRDSCPCSGAQAAWGQGPSLRDMEGQSPLLDRGERWGVSPSWASPSAGVGEDEEAGERSLAWLLEPFRQEGESQPMPVGSGQRPLPGALNARLSPSPNRKSLSPPIIQIGGGLCLLSLGFQTEWVAPPPTPPLSPLSSRGGQAEADARSSGRSWGSRLWRLRRGALAPRLPLLRPLLSLRLRRRRSLRKLRRV